MPRSTSTGGVLPLIDQTVRRRKTLPCTITSALVSLTPPGNTYSRG